MSYRYERSVSDYAKLTFLWLLSGVVAIGIIIGLIAGFKSFSRSQDMADAKNNANINLIKAHNQVETTAIDIQNQQQRVQVAQQQAQIRLEDAKGIRAAQDEVAKTLTPLYVQFEMTQALEKIAESGKNNSVVYIPAGAGGIPLVAGANGQPAVTAPDQGH